MSFESIQKQLKEVRTSYIASLRDKSNSIQALWQELQADWQSDVYEELYIIVHSLAGSAGTFDLPEVTDKARAVVDLFKENKSTNKRPNEELITQVDTLLSKLLNVMLSAK